LPENYFLTIDLGTSALKAILFDPEFNIVSSGSRETETIHPKPTWAQQDQNIWYRSTEMAIKEALTKANAVPEEVDSISMCAQMHGLSLVDESSNPLMPCLIWPDLRAISHAEAVNQKLSARPDIRTRRGNISAHYTAAKLLWVKENHPPIYEKAYKFLVPADYLRTKLTGDFSTDPTNAGGTEMSDYGTGKWNWGLIDFLGIRRSLFPEIHPSDEIIGSVTEKAASEMGLSTSTRVLTGGGDFSNTRPVLLRLEAKGCLLLYLGTAPIGGVITKDGNFQGIGGMSASGGAGLKWFKEQFCANEEYTAERTGQSPYFLMDQEMSMIKPGSEGVIFLPHLMGERRPYNDYARGSFFGLSLGHSREHLMRAVIEGITFQLRSYWEFAKNGLGVEIDRILVFGGGGKSRFWRQLIADAFGYPTYKLKYDDLSDLHLAVISSIALGYYKDLDEAYSNIDLSFIERLEPSTEYKDDIRKRGAKGPCCYKFPM
jgi:xylulokinase